MPIESKFVPSLSQICPKVFLACDSDRRSRCEKILDDHTGVPLPYCHSHVIDDSSIYVKRHRKQPPAIEIAAFWVIAASCAVGLLCHCAAFSAEHIQALSWLDPIVDKLMMIALVCALLILVGAPFYALPWLTLRVVLQGERRLSSPPSHNLIDFKPSTDTPPPRDHLH